MRGLWKQVGVQGIANDDSDDDSDDVMIVVIIHALKQTQTTVAVYSVNYSHVNLSPGRASQR
jgi:hypothetical protein